MSTTLGGVTLADPNYEREGCEMEAVDVGAMAQMVSGSLVYDSVTTRYRWSLQWNGITDAQRSAILTRYEVKTSQAFSPPDATTSYTVFVVPNTWRQSYLESSDGTERWFCEMQVEETS